MKIAFVSHNGAYYGANRSLLDLVVGLRQHAVEATIVVPAPSTDMLFAADRASISLMNFEVPGWVSPAMADNAMPFVDCARRFVGRAFGARLQLRVAMRLAAYLRSERYDVVYTNSSITPIGILAAHFSGLPHVWHLREFGDLDYQVVLDWGRRLSALAIARSATVICVSHAIASHYYPERMPTNLHVLYDGVATRAAIDRLAHRPSRRWSTEDPITIAIVGLIQATKGQKIAIEAFAQVAGALPRARLRIVGGGDDRELRALVRRFDLSERVEFTGFVRDPYTVFTTTDIALTCSSHEAMGRVTVEAMLAKCAVIGFRSGGTAELIDDGQTGLLYSGGATELAACILRVADDPALAEALGRRAHDVARERHDIEGYCNRVFRLLNGL